jgi:hypothetical protein
MDMATRTGEAVGYSFNIEQRGAPLRTCPPVGSV